jgi:hypothetical protein
MVLVPGITNFASIHLARASIPFNPCGMGVSCFLIASSFFEENNHHATVV